MKVSFFKVLGMIGTISEQLTSASIDGRIDIFEAVEIVRVICDQLGIVFELEHYQRVIDLTEKILEISKNGRCTLGELHDTCVAICNDWGIEITD
jgi:hypothetical protein